mmetsp:Transcript_6471/g.12272  ORF Transcript_6471/g.12272 Transcript_6471/m.12272 type:complete len:216 (-) Transcript_6471:208-855(-)
MHLSVAGEQLAAALEGALSRRLAQGRGRSREGGVYRQESRAVGLQRGVQRRHKGGLLTHRAVGHAHEHHLCGIVWVELAILQHLHHPLYAALHAPHQLLRVIQSAVSSVQQLGSVNSRCTGRSHQLGQEGRGCLVRHHLLQAHPPCRRVAYILQRGSHIRRVGGCLHMLAKKHYHHLGRAGLKGRCRNHLIIPIGSLSRVHKPGQNGCGHSAVGN